jgi:hypothetical protein
MTVTNGKNAVARAWRTEQSLQVISAGSSALSKGWASVVAAVGGGGSIWAALKGLAASDEQPLQRAVFLGSAALVLSAVVIAISIIVRADLAARAQAAAAEYEARARVAGALMNSFQLRNPLTVPIKYWLRTDDSQGQLDPKWHPVVRFERDKISGLVAVIDGNDRVPSDRILEWRAEPA